MEPKLEVCIWSIFYRESVNLINHGPKKCLDLGAIKSRPKKITPITDMQITIGIEIIFFQELIEFAFKIGCHKKYT